MLNEKLSFFKWRLKLMSQITLRFPRKKISSSEIVPKLIKIEHQLSLYILGNFDAIVSL